MPTAVLNGVRVHFRQVGRGPDLLLVHGLASDMAFWYLTVVPYLTARFRVTVYDLRGHGYSEMSPGGYTSADLAADLGALLDHLEIPRAHVVGHSFGGSVALHLAALQPDRVSTLALADARLHALQPPIPPRRSERWQTIRDALRSQGLVLPEDTPAVVYAVLEELLPAPTSGNGNGEGAVDRLFWSFARGAGGRRKLDRWLRLVETTTARDDFNAVAGLTRDVIRTVRTPTLAVYGERSGCMESCRGLEAHLHGCTTVVIPGEGHLHPVTRPALFAEHLQRFVASQGGRT
jgi:pimeloyl-ACP methyl ester carboxylesterase